MSEKKLGFGTMRLPLRDAADPASIDLKQTKQMVDAFLAKGFTYFDTAWMYCGGQSEKAVKAALVDRHPRSSFTLTTKLPDYLLQTAADRDKVFNTQLQRTGAGYFDYYLLHNVNANTLRTFEKLACFDWLRAKKRQGLAKKIGFSYHDGPELLDKLLTKYPDMDVVQLQLNYLDWESPNVPARAGGEVAKKHGKPIIVMEPVKGGTLAKLPGEAQALLEEAAPGRSAASWAVRFAAGLEGVMMVLSGMSDMAQLEDNTAYMQNFAPLTAAEEALVHKAAGIINSRVAIPCTGCEYCLAKCPKGIPIPKYFSLYNADMREREDKDWTAQMGYYDILAETTAPPAACVGCGACEALCPQHLPNRKLLKDVTKRLDG